MKEKPRFKEKDFDKAYQFWIGLTLDQVEELVSTASGSNRDDAFKRGYFQFPCKYQRNWILYPIYVAGKEWHKVNKIPAPICTDCNRVAKFQHKMNTDWYGVLKYYKCSSCKERLVSQDGGELAIAAPHR